MHVLAITYKDLLQMLRDKKAAFFLVVMPIVFTLMFGFAFSGGEGGAEEPALPVAFFSEDEGVLAAALQERLVASPLLALETVAAAEAVAAAVAAEEVAAGLVVPAGYDTALVDGETLPLGLLLLPESNGGQAARAEIEAAALVVASAARAAHTAAELHAARQPFTDGAARNRFYQETLDSALAAWQAPPVSLAITEAAPADENAASAFSHSSPAMMAQFAIASLLVAAQIIVLERTSRALQRLLTTAVARWEILLGHYLAIFVLIMGQLLVLTAFGQLILDLPYFRAPGATLLLALATALFAAALGLLIGTLAKTEEQVIILSLIPMFLLAALGGAWMPLEFAPSGFQQIARLTPLAWVVEGFKDILIRGQGVAAVLPGAGVLLLYTLLLLALAAQRFRSEAR